VRSWRRAAERNRRKKLPCCVNCKQPIPRSEPDVLLEDLKEGGRGYFHECCSMSAYVLLELDEPGAWRITHRHVNAEAN
jgi:hypothetical protein